jgi:hypothetical protein
VTGVDIEDHPDYPFTLLVADAMDVLTDTAFLAGFDVIHASPPCQHYAPVTRWRGASEDHPDLLAPVRELLVANSVPWVIENVPGAPMRVDYMLCGSMFGLRVRRHRWFEVSHHTYDLLPPCDHRRLLPFEHKGERAYTDALGCAWMTVKDGRDAVPPAYTEHIGAQLLTHLTGEEASA